MTSGKLSKSVSVSLVALAAATGVAAFGAGVAVADTVGTAPSPAPNPGSTAPVLRLPALSAPAIKVDLPAVSGDIQLGGPDTSPQPHLRLDLGIAAAPDSHNHSLVTARRGVEMTGRLDS